MGEEIVKSVRGQPTSSDSFSLKEIVCRIRELEDAVPIHYIKQMTWRLSRASTERPWVPA